MNASVVLHKSLRNIDFVVLSDLCKSIIFSCSIGAAVESNELADLSQSCANRIANFLFWNLLLDHIVRRVRNLYVDVHKAVVDVAVVLIIRYDRAWWSSIQLSTGFEERNFYCIAAYLNTI